MNGTTVSRYRVYTTVHCKRRSTWVPPSLPVHVPYRQQSRTAHTRRTDGRRERHCDSHAALLTGAAADAPQNRLGIEATRSRWGWRTSGSCRKCKLKRRLPWQTTSRRCVSPFPRHPFSVLRRPGRRHALPRQHAPWHTNPEPRPRGPRRTQSCCSTRTARWRTGWRSCARRSG
eukprot:COSAG02_NODE_232_length_27935_cov_16.544511_4_plen_174_part_00